MSTSKHITYMFVAAVALVALSTCAATGTRGKPDAAPAVQKESLPPPPTFGSVARIQGMLSGRPVGVRIAFWAESFVGTPYDTDPLGAYVRSEKLVCENEVDCMYHVFRSVELATSNTPEQAEERALELRFTTHGRLEGGRVLNYDERFQYGEDMVYSGKWGRDVTAELGATASIPGSRGRDVIIYLPKEELLKAENMAKLMDGDLIFFVKEPARRAVGEVVGHLGIVKMDGGTPCLIHASGSKSTPEKQGGGKVKKVGLAAYLQGMRFIGVIVTRF